MHQELAGIISLQIPSGAGPNDPAIVIGPTIPDRLTNYYAAGGPNGQVGVVIAAEIFRQSANTYTYQALVDPTVGLSFMAFGGIESVGLVVAEAYRVTPGSTTTTLGITGGFTIDGVTAGRGLVAQVDDVNASAAIGAEAVTLTLPSTVYKAGRAFEYVATGQVASSVQNSGVFNLRKTNTAGLLLTSSPFVHVIPGNGQKIVDQDVFVVGAADVTAVLVQTTSSTTGTTTWQAVSAGNPTPRRLRVYDIGRAAQYPDAPVLS